MILQLPAPEARAYAWQLQGLCRDASYGQLWFTPEFEGGRARNKRYSRAKAVCAQCPVMRDCAEHAMRAGEPYGVWGGLDERERQALTNAHKATATAS